MRFQSASFLASLAVMAACGTSALQIPEGFVPVKLEPSGPADLGSGAIAGLGPAVLGPGPEIVPGHEPTQPGSGPGGALNPTGLFGLVQDEVVYRMYCNRDKPLTGDYVRHYACFATNTELKKSLSAPNPQRLTGYINNNGTNFVLFAGQIVTLSESIEVHVEVPDRADVEPNKTCSQVKLYDLPEWKLKFDKQSCPGDDKPIKLDPPAAEKAA